MHFRSISGIGGTPLLKTLRLNGEESRAVIHIYIRPREVIKGPKLLEKYKSMAELSQREKNKLLAAADIVENGDLAVLKKILEFTDYLEENDVKLSDFFNKFRDEMDAYKEAVGMDVTTGVKSLGERLKECENLLNESTRAIDSLKGDTSEDKKEIQKQVSQLASDFARKIIEVKNLIPELPPEFDPTDILNTIREVEAKIPTLPEELTGDEIINQINVAEGLIDNERVEGFRELEKEVNDIKARPVIRGGVAGRPLVIKDDGVIVAKNPTFLNFTGNTITVDRDGTVNIPGGGVGGGSGDVSSNTSTSVNNEVALFSGTGGKTIKRATLTATVVKSTSGVLSAATAETDYVTPTGAGALTNKDLTSGTNTFPTLNQNTTGSAAKLTTARNIAGVPFDGTANISIASTNLSDTASIVLLTSTQTLTNKRITKRVLALSAGSATPAINTDSYDVVHITAQSAAITSFTTNLTGTPVDGDTLSISVKDDGTARALSFGASFEDGAAALPTTTVISTRLDIAFIWNTETTKWRCMAVSGATSSGSSLSKETPSGTVNDTNLTFTVTHQPFYINVNGLIYEAGDGIYASYSGGTITLSSPVGTGGFIKSYY